jgi:hypothetical protein
VATRRKKKNTWGSDKPVSERGETLYNTEEAADYLGQKPRWFRDHQDEIPYIRFAGVPARRMYRKEDLDAYIESKLSPAGR